ncbi:MAG TPA: TonB family protein [Pyrinomonadaceae bacterium]|nr:TonB family protein [Pyrinomonadaceae bacterium]
MRLNVRRFCTSVLLVFVFSIVSFAQTSAEVMRERVAKAKAFIAVKNYNAAIYELENIRRETKEPAVNGVINVLLMNSYLEQSDYKRAQEFLKELSNDKKPNALASYLAVAGQVVKGARNQHERYRALGLSVSDRNLPLEAVTDVEKMRETLELVVEQSKVLGKDKTKTSDAMALLEEATNARGGLARDDFDASRWKNEISDAREQLANSRSVVINAVDGTTTSAANTAFAAQTNGQPNLNTIAIAKPTETNTTSNPVPNSLVDNSKTLPVIKEDSKPQAESVARIDNPIQTVTPKEAAKQPIEVSKTDSSNSSAPPKNKNVETQVSENKPNPNEAKIGTQTTANKVDLPKTNIPLVVGSLLEYVTQKVNPIYPPAAKTVRMSGVVKVDVVVDEEGKVAVVQKTSGPQMLQRAATDAIRKWKFKPFIRGGQPTKATGYISFNFNL